MVRIWLILSAAAFGGDPVSSGAAHVLEELTSYADDLVLGELQRARTEDERRKAIDRAVYSKSQNPAVSDELRRISLVDPSPTVRDAARLARVTLFMTVKRRAASTPQTLDEHIQVVRGWSPKEDIAEVDESAPIAAAGEVAGAVQHADLTSTAEKSGEVRATGQTVKARIATVSPRQAPASTTSVPEVEMRTLPPIAGDRIRSLPPEGAKSQLLAKFRKERAVSSSLLPKTTQSGAGGGGQAGGSAPAQALPAGLAKDSGRDPSGSLPSIEEYEPVVVAPLMPAPRLSVNPTAREIYHKRAAAGATSKRNKETLEARVERGASQSIAKNSDSKPEPAVNGLGSEEEAKPATDPANGDPALGARQTVVARPALEEAPKPIPRAQRAFDTAAPAAKPQNPPTIVTAKKVPVETKGPVPMMAGSAARPALAAVAPPTTTVPADPNVPAEAPSPAVRDRREPGAFALANVPREEEGRRQMAREMLERGRQLVREGQLDAAEEVLVRVRELAVTYRRLQYSPETLEREVGEARMRRSHAPPR